MITMSDGKVIGPFERPTDVNVITTVVHPQPVIGLGNMLILNKVTEKATLKTPAQPAKPSTTDQTTSAGSANASGADNKNADTSAAGTKENKEDATADSGRAFSNELSNTDRMNGLLLRKVDTDTGALYREYSNLDAVAIDYPDETDVYKKAEAYFAQDNHSDRVAVLDYLGDKLQDTLKDFWTFNWTFAIFSVSGVFDDETVLASNIFEANQDHFLVLQSDDLGKYNAYYGQNFTIGLKHSLTEAMDAAFIGAIATLPVGTTTWKFKTLKGITADDVTVQERSGLDTTHAIGYIVSDGREETSEGFTLSGEFIDLLHGEIWMKTTVSNDLVDFLHNNSKVPYDHIGIGMAKSIVEGSMLKGYSQGIIAERGETGKGDYTVTATPREAQSKSDLSKRHYAGISFTYHASSAIHSLTVNGVVQSDTILS